MLIHNLIKSAPFPNISTSDPTEAKIATNSMFYQSFNIRKLYLLYKSSKSKSILKVYFDKQFSTSCYSIGSSRSASWLNKL